MPGSADRSLACVLTIVCGLAAFPGQPRAVRAPRARSRKDIVRFPMMAEKKTVLILCYLHVAPADPGPSDVF
ncbi:hypothetical protein C8J57DRAFT_1703667 [Mycena rebaudengoi]|nr:hypothetical protein C8J57DRAFT_1703667 [Mycena rebaudengoi]